VFRIDKVPVVPMVPKITDSNISDIYVFGPLDLDPDPLVRGMDQDPDPSIIKQK
jgi:hypothetical protein